MDVPIKDGNPKRKNDDNQNINDKFCKTDENPFKLNSFLLDDNFKIKFYNSWINNENGCQKIFLNETDDNIELISNPFKLCILQQFLQKSELIQKLVDEMCETKWERKKMDLYEFNQTMIDKNQINLPFLSDFSEFLEHSVMPWMAEITGIKLTSIKVSCSMYNAGDYLLVHDDLLSTRKIAFVYYLSPWENAKSWDENMGGALELFTADDNMLPKFPVVKKIYPKNNQFIFFNVSNKSFHQVGEIVSFDYPRLSINGWFHTDTPNEDNKLEIVKLSSSVNNYIGPHTNDIIMSEWINECFLNKLLKQQIQQHVEDTSEASLEEFLISEFYDEITSELKSNNSLKWIIEGPANQKYYEILDTGSVYGPIKDLLDLVTSKEFFKLLFDYTELDLHGKDARNPKCNVTLQKWGAGCYTILGGTSEYSDNSLDIIMYFNTNDALNNVGVITYLLPEEEQEPNSLNIDDESTDSDDSTILLTLFPKKNVLNLIYRSEGTARFTKYVPKICSKSKENLYILVYKYRMYSALAFIVVIIFVGVPMWWKTTEIYRVTLPTSGIESMNDYPIKILSNIGIYIKNNEKMNLIITELALAYQNHDFLKLNFIPILISDDELNACKTPANLEATILKKYKINFGEFIFVEWPKLTEDILVTSDRTAFISSGISSMKIKHVLTSWIFEEHKLKAILRNSTIRERNSPHNINAQSNYDILISVINPYPDLQKIHWNVRNAVEAYLEPFFNSISLLSNFTLKSQWKYQIEFQIANKQIRDNTKLGRHYSLQEENLPHIITSIERKLGSEVSKSPCIHLVVYVPPCQSAPLHIYRKNGERASKNNVDSFLSPNWGGIIIANPREDICLKYMETQEKVDFHINSQDVMQISLYLLRKIFDIQNDIPITGAQMTPIEHLTPRLWEIETFTRTRILQLLTSAQLTLKSLIKLLGDISYIVINDDVGIAINNAYKNIVIAKDLLEKGELENVIPYAKSAFAYSEKAFFDPSLLALLYFPDEQKYAIYIPLFLPIMIPVLLSLSSIKKFFFPNNKDEMKLEADPKEEDKVEDLKKDEENEKSEIIESNVNEEKVEQKSDENKRSLRKRSKKE